MVFQTAVTWETVTNWEGIALSRRNIGAHGKYGEPRGMENGGLLAWLEVQFVLIQTEKLAILGFPTTLQQW